MLVKNSNNINKTNNNLALNSNLWTQKKHGIW